MDLKTFNDSLLIAEPPQEWPSLLRALWFDKKMHWSKAHEIADGPMDKEAHWVHAYLHRKEGDQWNAEYWYQRAGKPVATCSLDKEWEQLVLYFLQKI